MVFCYNTDGVKITLNFKKNIYASYNPANMVWESLPGRRKWPDYGCIGHKTRLIQMKSLLVLARAIFVCFIIFGCAPTPRIHYGVFVYSFIQKERTICQ